jgi:hypothetical protein
LDQCIGFDKFRVGLAQFFQDRERLLGMPVLEEGMGVQQADREVAGKSGQPG